MGGGLRGQPQLSWGSRGWGVGDRNYAKRSQLFGGSVGLTGGLGSLILSPPNLEADHGLKQWELLAGSHFSRRRSDKAHATSRRTTFQALQESRREGGRRRRSSIEQAVEASRRFPPTKFDQSVELIFSLGIDAKQADQMIRGSLSLPHGIGKTKRVIAFCPEHLVDAGAQRRRDQGRRAGAGRRRSRRRTSPTSTSRSPRRT